MEFIYFSVGSLYFKEHETNIINELFNYFAYEIADLKYILLDINNACRGLGGCKKVFDVDSLQSVKYNKEKINLDQVKEETEEQRLERHKKFFKDLKDLVRQ